MSDFDRADCLERYFALVRARPERFANPPGDIYEILLEPGRIEHAQTEAARTRRREGLHADDTRVGVLAEDPYLLVLRDAVRFADGSYGLYNRLMVPSGAAILPTPRLRSFIGSVTAPAPGTSRRRAEHFPAPARAKTRRGASCWRKSAPTPPA
jgi:hypothetical protein